MKKETLEEAAERYEETDFYTTPTVETSQMMIQRAFINGANWQAERMYSEEEVLNIIRESRYSGFAIDELDLWFEQIKKK
jgi:hypothetical protein